MDHLNDSSAVIDLELECCVVLRSVHDAANEVKSGKVDAVDSVLVVARDLLENLMDGHVPHCLSHWPRALLIWMKSKKLRERRIAMHSTRPTF